MENNKEYLYYSKLRNKRIYVSITANKEYRFVFKKLLEQGETIIPTADKTKSTTLIEVNRNVVTTQIDLSWNVGVALIGILINFAKDFDADNLKEINNLQRFKNR